MQLLNAFLRRADPDFDRQALFTGGASLWSTLRRDSLFVELIEVKRQSVANLQRIAQTWTETRLYESAATGTCGLLVTNFSHCV
jgi:hypothetical protein